MQVNIWADKYYDELHNLFLYTAGGWKFWLICFLFIPILARIWAYIFLLGQSLTLVSYYHVSFPILIWHITKSNFLKNDYDANKSIEKKPPVMQQAGIMLNELPTLIISGRLKWLGRVTSLAADAITDASAEYRWRSVIQYRGTTHYVHKKWFCQHVLLIVFWGLIQVLYI